MAVVSAGKPSSDLPVLVASVYFLFLICIHMEGLSSLNFTSRGNRSSTTLIMSKQQKKAKQGGLWGRSTTVTSGDWYMTLEEQLGDVGVTHLS